MGLFDKLIGYQVKRKEIMIKDKPTFDVAERRIKVKPFITISRESGSGGRPISRSVAKSLGYKIYDKELMEMITKKTKKRKELIKSLDEKERGLVEDLVYSLFSPEYVAGETFLKHLCRVVLAVARKGNCVLIGRGANFITSHYGGLHVRIVAPFLVRAGYTAQYENYTIYEARERMKKFDRERKDFVKEYFGKDPSNPNYYDLVINTAYFNIEQATKIILAAFKEKFPDWKNYK